MHTRKLFARLVLLSATVSALLSVSGFVNLMTAAYGNFGRGAPKVTERPPFSAVQTANDGVRWYPRQVRYASDGTNILVGLLPYAATSVLPYRVLLPCREALGGAAL